MADVEFIFEGESDLTVSPLAPPGPLEFIFQSASEVVLITPPRGKRWRVVVTDVHGTVLGELPYAVLSTINFELNAPEDFEFTLLQNDPGIALLVDTPFREVQVWRGDQILAWGPVTRMAYAKDTFVASCHGALWHLTRRYIGKANRHNYILNPSFEDGTGGGWNYVTNPVFLFHGWEGAQADPPIHGLETFPIASGRKSLSLANTVPGADAWADQSITWVVDPSTDPDGDLFTLKGYVYVSAPIPPDAGAHQERGLYLERFSTTELNPSEAVQEAAPGSMLSIQTGFVPLNDSTPVGVWQRIEIALTTPPKAGEAETVNVRLYAPAGVTVYWDAIGLTRIEKLAFYGVDQAFIAEGIVRHLQDPAYGKSDVNISTHCPPTGVLRTRIYVHSEHPPGFGALEEFPKLDNGFDFGMSYTPTARIFTTFHDRRGSYKPSYALALPAADGTGNIADWTWAFDGEAASSSVIVLGSGDGSDREEGGAIDTSAWSDGVTMEEVFTAPDGTPIDALGSMATERLTVSRNPISLEITLLPGRNPDPIGALWPGDDVPVTINRHQLHINGTYRIVRAAINPVGNTMDLTLNLRVPL